jgi:hypothetical protein
MIKNKRFHIEISQPTSGVLSNLLAASIEVIAVIIRTTTILGFDTSTYSLTATFLNLK